MLDAVCRYLPAPIDVEAVKVPTRIQRKKRLRRPDAKDPFAALAFKIMTDPFVGRLAFFGSIPVNLMPVLCTQYPYR